MLITPGPSPAIYVLRNWPLAVVALGWIPWSGTRKVLAPALTGLLVSSIILLGALVGFLVRYNRGSAAFHI